MVGLVVFEAGFREGRDPLDVDVLLVDRVQLLGSWLRVVFVYCMCRRHGRQSSDEPSNHGGIARKGR